MSEILTASLLLLSAVIVFGLSVICFSLRDFSRSKLEELCENRGDQERFSHILRVHERIHLVLEAAILTLVIVTVWNARQLGAFEMFIKPQAAEFLSFMVWLIRVAGIFTVVCTIYVLLPWTIARIRGEQILFKAWPFLNFVSSISTPLWAVVAQADRAMHRLAGEPEPDSDAAAQILTEELLTVVDESQREGIIESNASTMIHRVVELHSDDVASIMTPRTDIVTLPATTTIRDAMQFVVEQGYSRVPVIRDRVDDVVGILYARDLLACAIDKDADIRSQTVDTLVRDVLYAPESQGIDDLLEAMRHKKVHMAMIVDEYSGVSGLVTLEDILEEIVGEISDEYDEEQEPQATRHQNGIIEIDARFYIDDLNEQFSLNLPEDEEYDTVGGFLLSCFGRIPATGEHYIWNNLRLTVLEADKRQLIRLRIDVEHETTHVAVQKNS